jgi:hypothetical protein
LLASVGKATKKMEMIQYIDNKEVEINTLDELKKIHLAQKNGLLLLF